MKKLFSVLLAQDSLSVMAQEKSKGLFDNLGYRSGEAVVTVSIEELVN